MEQYRNARANLKNELKQKLMCDRFGWEINIGEQNHILEIPITKEEYAEKVIQIDMIVRELMYELDVYIYNCECDPENYQVSTPTIFNLLSMSIEFDDTPIKKEDIYEVDPSTINRTVDSKWVGEYEATKIENVIQFWNEEKDVDLPHMPESVIKAVAMLGKEDPDFELLKIAIDNGDVGLINPSDHPQDQDNCSESTCCTKDDWGFTFKGDLEPLIDRCLKKGITVKDGHVVQQN